MDLLTKGLQLSLLLILLEYITICEGNKGCQCVYQRRPSPRPSLRPCKQGFSSTRECPKNIDVKTCHLCVEHPFPVLCVDKECNEDDEEKSKKKALYIGVGIGIGLLFAIIVCIVAVCLWLKLKKKHSTSEKPEQSEGHLPDGVDNDGYTTSEVENGGFRSSGSDGGYYTIPDVALPAPAYNGEDRRPSNNHLKPPPTDRVTPPPTPPRNRSMTPPPPNAAKNKHQVTQYAASNGLSSTDVDNQEAGYSSLRPRDQKEIIVSKVDEEDDDDTTIIDNIVYSKSPN